MTLKLPAAWPITSGAMNYRPATLLLCVLALVEVLVCLVTGVSL